MAQNIYDDEGFFAAYAQLPRSIGGLDSAPEWSSIQEMLPDMTGLRVRDRYLIEGERVTDWLAPGVVKQHRTVATYVNTLIGAGFRLQHLSEWGPSAEQIAAVPEWSVELDRPFLLLASATKE